MLYGGINGLTKARIRMEGNPGLFHTMLLQLELETQDPVHSQIPPAYAMEIYHSVKLLRDQNPVKAYPGVQATPIFYAWENPRP